jgi:hypothetical protein
MAFGASPISLKNAGISAGRYHLSLLGRRAECKWMTVPDIWIAKMRLLAMEMLKLDQSPAYPGKVSQGGPLPEIYQTDLGL